MAEARFERVSKRFGAATALEDVSLDIHDGEFVRVAGTDRRRQDDGTSAASLALKHRTRAECSLAAAMLLATLQQSRDVAFVFQQYSLYPNLSVYDNLAFPLRSPARRLAEVDIDKKVKAIACLLHLEGKLDVRPTQLSGGQMQRVALGRALVRRPTIYLMDEPLSSLDAKLRAELRLELKRIQQDLGATILYVTHDQTEAMTLANRIGVLQQGRLVQVGTPRRHLRESLRHLRRNPPGQPAHQSVAAQRLSQSACPCECGNDRGEDRASAHSQGDKRVGRWHGDVDRASGRSEPSSCLRRRPETSSR